VSLAVLIRSMASLYDLRGQSQSVFGRTSRGVLSRPRAGRLLVGTHVVPGGWCQYPFGGKVGMSRKGIAGETNSLKESVIKDEEKSAKSDIEISILLGWLSPNLYWDLWRLKELTPHQVSSSWSHA
jgi:hypothetical protein